MSAVRNRLGLARAVRHPRAFTVSTVAAARQDVEQALETLREKRGLDRDGFTFLACGLLERALSRIDHATQQLEGEDDV